MSTFAADLRIIALAWIGLRNSMGGRKEERMSSKYRLAEQIRSDALSILSHSILPSTGFTFDNSVDVLQGPQC